MLEIEINDILCKKLEHIYIYRERERDFESMILHLKLLKYF